MSQLTIQARGYDRDSAAMSIAANRLSKVRLLLNDETERCNLIALRFAKSLAADIDEHLKEFPQTSEATERELRYIAEMALDETEEATS